MSWLWPNLTLGVLFFGCWVGIPLWMVLRDPTWGPVSAHGHGTQAAAPMPVFVAEEVVLDGPLEDKEISEFETDDALVD
jgi:hypothetical protein